MQIKGFDKECFDQIHERFQYFFEDELIVELCSKGQQKSVKAEKLIMDIGDMVNFIPILLEGSIKIMTEDENGDELLLYYLEHGDTCAVTLDCCTKQTKSRIRAIAELDSELLLIPIEMMDIWMVKFQTWRAFVLESYNSRLNEMLQAIDLLVFHSMEERIKNYLREKAIIGKSSIIHLTHLEISRDLHSSRVVISRLLKKMEKQGLITQHRNKLEYLEFSDKLN